MKGNSYEKKNSRPRTKEAKVLIMYVFAGDENKLRLMGVVSIWQIDKDAF